MASEVEDRATGRPKHWHPDVSWTPGQRGAEKYGRKPTRAEVEKRVGIVAELLVRGYSRVSMLRYLSKSTDWDVTSRTVDLYLSRARDSFVEHREADRKRFRAIAEEQLAEIHRSALQAGSYAAARGAVRELLRLRGLYPDGRRRQPPPGLTPTDPQPDEQTSEPTTPRASATTTAARAATAAELLTLAAQRLAVLVNAGAAAPGASLPLPSGITAPPAALAPSVPAGEVAEDPNG